MFGKDRDIVSLRPRAIGLWGRSNEKASYSARCDRRRYSAAHGVNGPLHCDRNDYVRTDTSFKLNRQRGCEAKHRWINIDHLQHPKCTAHHRSAQRAGQSSGGAGHQQLHILRHTEQRLELRRHDSGHDRIALSAAGRPIKPPRSSLWPGGFSFSASLLIYGRPSCASAFALLARTCAKTREKLPRPTELRSPIFRRWPSGCGGLRLRRWRRSFPATAPGRHG